MSERPSWTNRKVLVVEDYEFNREIIVDMLKLFGIEPDIAINGKEAVERARSTQYELILMDIRMPVMDGYQASQEIRKIPDHKPLIIALTASSALREKDKFNEIGMDDFLIKPIELNELENTLKKYLK